MHRVKGPLTHLRVVVVKERGHARCRAHGCETSQGEGGAAADLRAFVLKRREKEFVVTGVLRFRDKMHDHRPFAGAGNREVLEKQRHHRLAYAAQRLQASRAQPLGTGGPHQGERRALITHDAAKLGQQGDQHRVLAVQRVDELLRRRGAGQFPERQVDQRLPFLDRQTPPDPHEGGGRRLAGVLRLLVHSLQEQRDALRIADHREAVVGRPPQKPFLQKRLELRERHRDTYRGKSIEDGELEPDLAAV